MMTVLSLAAAPPINDQDDGDRRVVAVAWPTRRPIYAYTREELAGGVDLYTRWLKAAGRPKPGEQRA